MINFDQGPVVQKPVSLKFKGNFPSSLIVYKFGNISSQILSASIVVLVSEVFK